MSQHHNNPNAPSYYYRQEREHRRPGVGRYAISQDEYSSSAAQSQQQQQHRHYVAPSLSHRSTTTGGGMSTEEGSEMPDDEYMTSGPSESVISGAGVSAASSQGGEGFVTEPPRPRRGLTGKISTLFRRDERSSRQGASSSSGVRRKKPMSTSTSSSHRDRGSSRNGGNSSRKQRQQQQQNSMDQQSGLSSAIQSMSSVGEDDEEDDRSHGDHSSVGSSRSRSVSSHGSKRIFYSTNDDDDSDDSYESRMSQKEGRGLHAQHTESSSYTVTTNGSSGKTIVRYRGFSTSIKSLFLDETVVCASMGCFGLILSNRTEYLLNLRNERRGALKRHHNIERKKLPSRIVAYGLLVTIILMFATFVVWGTGDGLTANRYFDPNADNIVDHDDLYYYDLQNRNNDDDGNNDDQVQQQDDQVNDDDGNAWYNNDDQQQDDDDGNNNDDDDWYNQNQYNNNQQNDDDGNAGNDDGNAGNDDDQANNNDDDQAAVDDDQAAVDDDDAAANNIDDYYAYDDDGNRRVQQQQLRNKAKETSAAVTSRRRRRRREVEMIVEHPVHGIFKLRDYQENLWDPLLEFAQDEWHRYQQEQQERAQVSSLHHRQRHLEDAAYGDDNYNNNNDDGNGGSSNTESEGDDGENPYGDLASNIRIALLFAFLLFLGVLGRRRRMRTRFYLVRARAQEDHLYYASTQVGETKRVNYDNSREDQYEGACSHTLCGWYPADEIIEEEEKVDSVEVTDNGVFKRKKKHHNEDVVARAFNCLMATCCGFACKCWFQCLSICALAQEAREIRLLVPPRYQRIDFITHQPFHEYQKEVNDLRRGWLGKSRKKVGVKPHFNALSRLSRYILVSFFLALVAIVATLIFNPRAAFSWPDAVVLGATFLQSFLVLFIVHWIFHKSDLSLDAVIKMFAAGFVIAVPSAFFFEGLVANLFLFLAWSLYEFVVFIGGDVVAAWIYSNWRIIWVLGELFNAYMVAAVTEEICKYYTFRTVEHPDLVFLTGLTRVTQDHSSVEGGIVKYPFASHKVQELNRTGSFGEMSQFSHRSSQSKRSRRDLKLIERTGTMEEEFEEDETDARTYRQKAMAITTGMISVAVGLACAENFLYVFVLGGASSMGSSYSEEDDRRNDLLEEWIILLFRSVFPIHALSAALQSINMIRKFVETDEHNGHRIGVGRILVPAVILHGTFDAILMLVNYYQEVSWENYLREHNGNVGDDGGPYNPLVVNLVAWSGITIVMLAGILWYYRENRKQRDRLKLLEEQAKHQKEDSWDNEHDFV